MDKLRDLANGERRHIGMSDAREIVTLWESHLKAYRGLVQFCDEQAGAPCAQIRWQQERADFQCALRSVGYYEEDGDYWHIARYKAALEKIAKNDTDGLHMFTPQAMQETALRALASTPREGDG